MKYSIAYFAEVGLVLTKPDMPGLIEAGPTGNQYVAAQDGRAPSLFL